MFVRCVLEMWVFRTRVKYFLPKPAQYKLYCSLIIAYLTYGILFWGSASKEYMTKLFKIQKRALRVVSNSSSLSDQSLFEKFNTLNIFYLYPRYNLSILYTSTKMDY